MSRSSWGQFKQHLVNCHKFKSRCSYLRDLHDTTSWHFCMWAATDKATSNKFSPFWAACWAGGCGAEAAKLAAFFSFWPSCEALSSFFSLPFFCCFFSFLSRCFSSLVSSLPSFCKIKTKSGRLWEAAASFRRNSVKLRQIPVWHPYWFPILLFFWLNSCRHAMLPSADLLHIQLYYSKMYKRYFILT